MERKRIVPLSAQLVISAANAMVGLHAETDTERGQVVEMLLREVRQPMDGPWHAAFVHHVGYWSHYDHEGEYSSWPLPATGNCNDLARFAAESRILSVEHPDPGEVFLLWSPARRAFVHAGLVLYTRGNGVLRDGSLYVDCVTIEGNTDEHARINGRGMHRTARQLSADRGDRFIRWVNLDSRSVPSDPATASEVCMGRMLRARAA